MSSKEQLRAIFNELLVRIQPQKLIKKQCQFNDNCLVIDKITIPLGNKKIKLFGSGKAVVSMAQAMHEILGNKIQSSFLVGAYDVEVPFPNTTYVQSSHPLPSKTSVDAAQQMICELESLDEDDIFIYLLSGGSSALLELPEEGISLQEFQQATDVMLKGAMPIEAMNSVRKHLSSIKGGKLIRNCKAKGYVLVLSDVLGDDLQAIGSAPLYYDETTFTDTVSYLNEYELFEQMPKSIQHFLEDGINKKVPDTPKKESANIEHILVGSNTIVLNEAKAILDSNQICNTINEHTISQDVTSEVKKLLEFMNTDKDKPFCFIFGGEATVKVSGSGQGGRNQHLALSLLEQLPSKSITVLCAATDGIDGNSDAAGAVIVYKDKLHKSEAIKKHLENFDSYNFFKQTDGLIMSGPTHNNLLDITLILIEPNK